MSFVFYVNMVCAACLLKKKYILFFSMEKWQFKKNSFSNTEWSFWTLNKYLPELFIKHIQFPTTSLYITYRKQNNHKAKKNVFYSRNLYFIWFTRPRSSCVCMYFLFYWVVRKVANQLFIFELKYKTIFSPEITFMFGEMFV